jgi:HK97 gp10 family phage protein
MPTVNNAIEVDIKGLSQVLKVLRLFPPELQKKGLNTAMRKGATVVRKSAINNVRQLDRAQTPKQKIYRNVVVQYAPKYSKYVNGVVMRVGVLGGAKQYGNTKQNVRKGRVGKTYKTGGDKGNPGGDTWYWRFLEFGVPSLGIAARKPLTMALERNVQTATNVITTSLSQEITVLANKLRGGKK